MVKEKTETLDEALATIDKEWGKGSIFVLAESPETDIECMSTGILPLDVALGVRAGIPRGRITEIFGPPQSGKTTIVLTTIAEAQKRGETCAFIDAEHAFDPAYARTLGVDPDRLLMSQPDTGEQAFFTMEHLCKTKQVSVIGVDSVAALLPRNMREGDYGDAFVGMHPKFMSQSVPKLVPHIDNGVTAVMFINQLRKSIGVQYGNPEYRPGGNAVPYYSSVGLDVRKIRTDKDKNDDPFSSRTKVKVVKSKVGIPYKVCEFDLEYGVGVPRANCIIDLGVEYGLIIQKGAWFATANGENIGQGKQNAIAWLNGHPEESAEIERQILEAVSE